MRPLYKPRSQSIESRGWLFMGEQGGPCDKACTFCYYSHQDNLVFYSFDTLLAHANLFRHYYKLDACDITGGEATIYKRIVELVAHCAGIGLKPTIITHAQNIRNDFTLGGEGPLYRRIEAAGLEDWLISLHGGSAASHDAILCQEGSFDRLIGALYLVNRPVRFNTTLCDTNYKDLPVNILADRPPTVWNPIMFNPFHYWHDKTGSTEIDFQAKYRDIAPYLAKAIEKLEGHGWEVNVRYWPFCIAEDFGFAKNVSGYHQVPYDPWEWRLNVSARSTREQIAEAGGWEKAENALATRSMAVRECERCDSCSRRLICDKPPNQYQQKYGTDELSPVSGDAILDPLHFQRGQPLV